MFQIIGVVVVFVMVFGGFMLAGGHFDVIIKAAPFEMMMIGGAAIGALVGGVVGRMIGEYMDAADKKRLAETIDAAPSGQTVSWHNDDTGRDFAVTPTSDFYADAGKECRRFDQVVYVDGRREVMEGVACRTPGDDSFDFSGQSA